jgi:4-hydroxy-tetrahydrodipicolinate synthase
MNSHMKHSIPKRTDFPIHGVLAALVTPFDARGAVDVDRLASFVEYLIDRGVHGLIPLGSTGEYYALTADERDIVIRTTLEAARGRATVIPGTNAGSTAEVVAYSRQAQALGCQGVMLAAPYYSLPTEDELFEHFRAVDRAVDIPVMLYNYPARTGVDMSPAFIERLTQLRSVQYVKESTGEMPRITELIRRCGERLGVFCGCDTLALESLVVGAIGWVGGVVNVLPAAHVRLYVTAVERSDYAAARDRFYDMLPLMELMEGGGKYTQFVKAACMLMGHDVGPPRPPLRVPNDAEMETLRTVLAPWRQT